jgi:hypothetical protein
MAASPGKPNLSKEQHRVLALLDHIPHGITENTLVLAHGFDGTMIASLIDAGLATGQREIVTGPGRTTIEVVRIRISDAGRRAIEG